MPVVRAAPAIALLLFGVSASSAGSPRQYEDYHDSAYLPYLKRAGFRHKRHKRLADGVYGRKAAPLYASERHGGCQLGTTARISDLAESQRHDQFIPVRKEDLFS